MMNRPAARGLLCGIVLVLASGCSRRPSVDDIARQLARDTATCENIRIRDVQKVDGYEDGDNRYVAEVRYVIELRKIDTTETADSNPDEAVRRAQCLIAELPLRLSAALEGDPEHLRKHQDVVMRRTENGWRLIESSDR